MVSVVTSAHNEAGNLPTFIERVLRCYSNHGLDGEVVVVEDGSTDGTREALESWCARSPLVRPLIKPKREGLSAAINSALTVARGDVVVLLPADLESDPLEDIPKLLSRIHQGYDVVTGWRQGRRDRKGAASVFANGACRLLFGLRVHDMNWIKAIRRSALDGLTLHSDWFRYLVPILATRGCRIAEVRTSWHPRAYGSSKFGARRLLVSSLDILALVWRLKVRRRLV